MTVATNVTSFEYATDGSTTVFSLANMLYLDVTHVKAVHHDTSTKVSTTLVKDTDFTLSGDGTAGTGVFTTVGTLATGYLEIWRDSDGYQSQAFTENGANPATQLEAGLDATMLKSQEAAGHFDTALRRQRGDLAVAMELPLSSTRALKVLTFDATGAPSTTLNASLLEDAINDALGNFSFSGLQKVTDIAAMKGLPKSGLTDGDLIQVLEYASGTSRGGAMFQWHATSTATDNAGTVHTTGEGGTGRWIMWLFHMPEGYYKADWFGAAPTATADTNRDAFDNAQAAAATDGGGTVVVSRGEHTVSKLASYNFAIRLRDSVNFIGVSMGSSNGSDTGSKIKLDASQNCYVIGSSAAGGVSRCHCRMLNIHANRANNLTSGGGLYLEHGYSDSFFGDLRIGQCRERGFMVNDSSSPLHLYRIFTGATGKEGFYIDGAFTYGSSLNSCQADNAGLDGGGEAGFYFHNGSTQDSNLMMFDCSFEQNTGTEATANDLAIQLNNMNGSNVTIISFYAKTDDASAVDAIKVTGTAANLNLIGVSCDSDYTNILNDVPLSQTVAYTSEGIPFMYNNVLWSDLENTRAVAWCSVTVSAGSPTLNSSFNVSSITDNGVGDFTINFTSALPANYSVTASGGRSVYTNQDRFACINPVNNTSARLTFQHTAGAGNTADPEYFGVHAYGDRV